MKLKEDGRNTGTRAIKKRIPLSKAKRGINKTTNGQNTIRTHGQPSGQLFPKRWDSATHTELKVHHQNSDTKNR